MVRLSILALMGFVFVAMTPACHRAMPDPLISGQRLSVWIASLEDRDPEVQLKALRAIGKLERGSRKKPDGTVGPAERAADAEAARLPIEDLEHRPTTLRVALAAQYDLWVLFQETNSAQVDIALQMLVNGSEDESRQACSLLQHYPDKADRITDAALKLVLDTRAPPLQQVNGILLLCKYPAEGWRKISEAHSTGSQMDRVLFESARREVEKKAIASGVWVLKPAPTPNPTPLVVPDWITLAVGAKQSAQAWEARYWTLNSDYATRFAHVPRDSSHPPDENTASPDVASTPMGRFQQWDQRGKEWRRACEDLQRRMDAGTP